MRLLRAGPVYLNSTAKVDTFKLKNFDLTGNDFPPLKLIDFPSLKGTIFRLFELKNFQANRFSAFDLTGKAPSLRTNFDR